MKKRYKILLILVAILTVAYFYFTRDTREIKVLVFSKTTSFRHESIAAGKKAILALGEMHGFFVDTTERADQLTEENLANYNVLIFLNTTGDVLNDAQQLEMNRWVQAGGGYVGIHAAADTEYDWPWYGELVGAYFESHPNDPNVRDAEIQLVDKNHISTSHLPDVWARTDEWYNYKEIQPEINVLLNLDESSYKGGTNGEEHPITWYRDFDGGRSWYTGLGHTPESFEDQDFLTLLLGGIEYAAGPGVPVNYDNASVAPEENRFQKVVLDSNLDEPMELEVLPNEDLLFIERKGAIKLYKADEQTTKLITTLPVFSELEDGLLGLALDPNYSENKWIYLFYSPEGNESIQRVSRFSFVNESLDLDSEQILLTIPTQREECCHSAGSLEFGPEGHLFIALGDNTSPRATGYGPIDEGEGRKNWDAQRTSGNTQDLRGKILRILPQSDGTYTIPDGNLFSDETEGKPEIYVMGVRNPFRIAIDQKNGNLYWGDVGPDAGMDSTGFGSRGYDEVNQARAAGNFGWPYFIAANFPYHDYDYPNATSGPLFDPAKPENSSPNNTGAQQLPPAQPAMIYYPYSVSEDFPLTGEGGRNAMAGPVFYEDLFPVSENRYPSYYDGKLFTYDWMRGWIMAVTFDDNGDMERMERFLPNTKFNNLMDLISGPSGDLYALEYGTNWFTQNMDARLIHLAYSSANRVPVAKVSASQTIGKAPLNIQFQGDGSLDFDGDELTYVWDFGNGQFSSDVNPGFQFDEPGDYSVSLQVTDPSGEQSSDQIDIKVGNDLPNVRINFTGNRSFYWNNGKLNYEVTVSDTEDGQINDGIDPNEVTFTADYLAQGYDVTTIVQGHQANQEASAHVVGKSLLEGSDCQACHHSVNQSVGPSLTEIANRYASEGDAVIKTLAQTVINGGSGQWGDLMMAPHPQLSERDAEKMIKFILSLNEDFVSSGLPHQGTYALDQHGAKETEGTYIFTASYTDRGAKGAEALTATDVISLRYPLIQASNFTEKKKVMTFLVTKEVWDAVEEEFTLVIPSHEGFFKYEDIDLTGVGSIKLTLAVAPTYFSGGSLEVSIDQVDGPVISRADFEVGLTDIGAEELTISLDAVDGIHDLYFKVNCKDLSKAFAGFATLEFQQRK
ncbi:MAG: ThuA domain-containing protein [Cytophagales bacterium]|nr:ThuA domain-containing protein [Cytophagales bacterium]